MTTAIALLTIFDKITTQNHGLVPVGATLKYNYDGDGAIAADEYIRERMTNAADEMETITRTSNGWAHCYAGETVPLREYGSWATVPSHDAGWWLASLPEDANTTASDTPAPGSRWTIGMQMDTIRDLDSMPVGTVFTWKSGRETVTRTAEGWHHVGPNSRTYDYARGEQIPCRQYDDGWSLTLSVVNDDEVLEAMERVKSAIWALTSTEGWWREGCQGMLDLGMDPYETDDVDTVVNLRRFARRFPPGSICRDSDGDVWQIGDLRRSTCLTSEHKNRLDLDRPGTHEVRVIYCGQRPVVTTHYPDVKAFLRAVHEKQRELQNQYSWCGAVEHALEDAELDDPGPEPEPEPGYVVGDTFNIEINRERWLKLPVGTVLVTGDTTFLRAGERIVDAVDLIEMFSGPVTVSFIPA